MCLQWCWPYDSACRDSMVIGWKDLQLARMEGFTLQSLANTISQNSPRKLILKPCVVTRIHSTVETLLMHTEWGERTWKDHTHDSQTANCSGKATLLGTRPWGFQECLLPRTSFKIALHLCPWPMLLCKILSGGFRKELWPTKPTYWQPPTTLYKTGVPHLFFLTGFPSSVSLPVGQNGLWRRRFTLKLEIGNIWHLRRPLVVVSNITKNMLPRKESETLICYRGRGRHSSGWGMSWERQSPAPSFLLYLIQSNKDLARAIAPMVTKVTRPGSPVPGSRQVLRGEKWVKELGEGSVRKALVWY